MDRPTDNPRTPARDRPAPPRIGPAGPARDTRRQFVTLGLAGAGLVAIGVLIAARYDDPSIPAANASPAPSAVATAGSDAATPDAAR